MRDEPGVARIGSLANLLGIARILARHDAGEF